VLSFHFGEQSFLLIRTSQGVFARSARFILFLTKKLGGPGFFYPYFYLKNIETAAREW
jgi:hypothetical protein